MGQKLRCAEVSRHQDMLYKGNALTKEDHYEDARLIKELGQTRFVWHIISILRIFMMPAMRWDL